MGCDAWRRSFRPGSVRGQGQTLESLPRARPDQRKMLLKSSVILPSPTLIICLMQSIDHTNGAKG